MHFSNIFKMNLLIKIIYPSPQVYLINETILLVNRAKIDSLYLLQ
jgi:hypothetical protein